MTTIDLQPVKGTRDFYPDDMRLRTWLFARWREVATRFGYEEYDACVLESEELYIRKAGDEITSQLYNFQDKGERRVALRPEMTPSLARMVMARGAALPLPARWFAIPQCFRYENMQRGRKREHFQWNMDVIGLDSVAAEAELMAAQVEFLRSTGLNLGTDKPDIVFKVSNRHVLGHFLANLAVPDEKFAEVCVIIDKLDKIGAEATGALLKQAGITDAVIAALLPLLTEGQHDAIEKLVGADNPGWNALRELKALCDSFGIGHLIRIDLSVVRGLSYYTGTVWEVFDATGTLPRAIAGGGRYDRLVEQFGGTALPMVGFGFGDVVILEILRERNLLPAAPRALDDVIYPMQASGFALANRIAANLRRGGRNVAVDYTLRRFKHVVQRAEADGAKRLLILGGDEIARGVCKARTLGARDEVEISLADLTG